MVEPSFGDFREGLLRAGVAPRHAYRAVVEIEAHYRELLDDETGRGVGDREARIEARRRLGTNQELIHRYAAQPELRAWSRRWPALCFMIVPLFACLAAGLAALMTVLVIAKLMAPYLHQVNVAPGLTHGIDLAAQVLLLWCLPLCVAAAFTLLGRRRGLALRWPLVCIVSTSALASLCNVVVNITGGEDGGAVGAGIRLSTNALPQQSMHAAALVALSLLVLWTLRRPRRHRSPN